MIHKVCKLKNLQLFQAIILLLLSSFFQSCEGQKTDMQENPGKIITGATQIPAYKSFLEDKRVGMVVNQTSVIRKTHLVDTLLSLGINITKIFAPEHGFRGTAAAGETVENSTDVKTGLKIISLYSSNKKPTPEQVKDLDLIIFDIQDVGARFYTYISTMHYVMEACAENNLEFLVLDRPNPNGNYIDGPILQPEFKSFVGMHPIPIVHGLTVGELAQMINGEEWLAGSIQCNLKVIPIKNYTHKDPYSLPIKPSPNLPNDLSIKLYPSLCLFEGTKISIGRGTTYPFQVIGYPDPDFGDFKFVPESIEGMANYPKHESKVCYGIDFRETGFEGGFTLKYLIKYYQIADFKEEFFTSYFNKLAGNDELVEKIKSGISEEEIKESWQEPLKEYKQIRKKYLLYPDFE